MTNNCNANQVFFFTLPKGLIHRFDRLHLSFLKHLVVESKLRNICIWEERKTRVSGKESGRRKENQQLTQHTCNSVHAGTRTHATIKEFKQRRFQRHTSTGSELFAFLSSGFPQIFEQIVLVRVKTLSITNLVALRHFKKAKASLPVDVRGSKTSLLKVAEHSFARGQR